MKFPQTCRVDVEQVSDPVAKDREITELETLVAELIDPQMLSFECFRIGTTQLTDQGYPYMAWFTIKATGEIFPVNFTFECEQTPLDIWMDPDWFSGSIYVVLGIHRSDFIKRLQSWMELQWDNKKNKNSFT
ncbi:MAG: hypothetical protein IAF58_06660 [Leptolyngbya sp.]|nr:hypothetical protein [Candidatus Melainabacteria bacterium]